MDLRGLDPNLRVALDAGAGKFLLTPVGPLEMAALQQQISLARPFRDGASSEAWDS
jgi:hypothetical protein